MFARSITAIIILAATSGCSGVTFSRTDNGRSHPYRVAQPALKVVAQGDCSITAEVISIPGEKRYVSFRNGIGKADVSIEFEPGGTIKTINSKTEGAVDDVLKIASAVTGARVGSLAPNETDERLLCPPSVRIYPIQVDQNGRINFDPTTPLLSVTNP